MNNLFRFVIVSLVVLFLNSPSKTQDAALLPNGKQTFFDNSGNPLSAGKVYFYIPNTSTLKTTWVDADKNTANSNPVILDGAGRAIIYGDGEYRQVVRDRNNNLVWDQVTSSAGSGGGTTSTGDGDLVGTIKPWAGLTAPNQYLFAYGQEIARATYPALYTAITLTTSAFCTSSSPILTGIADTGQIPIGAAVEASCLAAGSSTVISKTASTITLGANANVSTSLQIIVYPWGNGNASTTFNLPDLRGRVIAGRDNMGGTAASRLTTTYFGNASAIGATGGTQSKTLSVAELPAHTHEQNTQTHSFTNSEGTSFATTGGATAVTAVAATGLGNTVVTSPGAAPNTDSTGSDTPFSLVQPTITSNYIIKVTPDTSSSDAPAGVLSIEGMTGVLDCGYGLLCTGNTLSVDLPIDNSGYFIDTYGDIAAAIVPATYLSIYTNGFYTSGGGGGAQYVRVASEPSLPVPVKVRSGDRYLPDGSTDPTNGGWWQLANLGTINLLQLGGKEGNDAANVAYNSAAFDAAYLVHSAEGRGKLKLPAGVFRTAWMSSSRVGSTFILLNNTSLEGAGAGVSFIQMDNIKATDGIQGVTTGANGAGYPASSTFTDIPLLTLTGTGTGARATITTGGGGAVSGITITYPGTGYALTDTVGVDNANTGGTGAGFVREVDDLTNVAGIITASGTTNMSVSNLSIDGDKNNEDIGGQSCIRGGDLGVTNFRIDKVNISNCKTYGIGVQGDAKVGNNNNVWVTNVKITTTGYDGIDFKNKSPSTGVINNGGFFIDNVEIEDFGADIDPTEDVAAVDCRSPCRISNVYVKNFEIPSIVATRVCVRLRSNGISTGTPEQVGGEWASVTGVFCEATAGTGTASGNVIGVRIQGSGVTVSNVVAKNVTTGYQIYSHFVSMSNLIALDFRDYGFWYLANPNPASASDWPGAKWTTCNGCKAVRSTVLAGTVGFNFANGTHATEVPTGNTITDPLIYNVETGIVIASLVLDTRIRSPQFKGTVTTQISDASANGQTNLSWDLVTLNGATIVAAATTVLDKATGDTVEISGNTGISAITLAEGRSRMVRFTGTPVITSGPSLGLPTSATTIQVEVGDRALIRGYSGGVVRVMWYQRNSGVPLNGVYTLPCTTTQISHTGNTNETKLVGTEIPARAIGANGTVTVTYLGSRNSGGAGNVTYRVRFGTANDLTGTQLLSVALGTANQQTHVQNRFANRNNTASQIATASGTNGGWGPATAAVTTSAIDTTGVTYVVLSGQLGTGTDTVAIEQCTVEILNR